MDRKLRPRPSASILGKNELCFHTVPTNVLAYGSLSIHAVCGINEALEVTHIVGLLELSPQQGITGKAASPCQHERFRRECSKSDKT
jgi:hypothetical protein